MNYDFDATNCLHDLSTFNNDSLRPATQFDEEGQHHSRRYKRKETIAKEKADVSVGIGIICIVGDATKQNAGASSEA